MDSETLEFANIALDPIPTDSTEFGRESLGILPPDFGRESMGFSNPKFLNEIKENCLGLRRKSLGVLDLSAYNANLSPDILSTISENGNENVCDLLNKAFVFPSPRKYSLPSFCSNVSLNGNSIEEPSKIFSVQSPNDEVFEDNLNYNSDSIISTLNRAKYLSSSELNISGLPFNQITKLGVVHKDKLRNEDICHDLIFIEGQYFANKLANGTLLDDSFDNEVGNLDNVPQPQWPEVFVSPNKISDLKSEENVVEKPDQKIEIKPEKNLEQQLNFKGKSSEEIETEVDQVNDFEPEADSKNSEDIRSEADQNNVQPEADLKLAVSQISNSTTRSAKELLHNLSEILNNTSRSDQQRSKGQHLLNSLDELLSDGSNIWSRHLDDSGHSSSINDLSDPEKNTNDCYEILDFSHKSESGRRLGNSSKENSCSKEKQSKFSDLNSNRLSLSLNSAVSAKLTRPKILNRGNLSKISLNSSKNKTGSSNSSVKSDNMSAGNVFVSQNNLKLKTNTEVSRKGPLKAVIPVKELKKSGKLRTPERTENAASFMRSKKTTMPISKPKLKPMAASTPTQKSLSTSNRTEMNASKNLPGNSKGTLTNGNDAINSHIQPANSNTSALYAMRKRTLPLSTSPLVRNPRKQDDGTTNFAKSPKVSYNSARDKAVTPKQTITTQDLGCGKRRNSISSLKKEQVSGRPRSNSLPKEPIGIMSSMNKIRQNLLNSSELKNLNKKSLLKENNVITEIGCNGNTSALAEPKRDSISRLKKIGKENLAK